MSLQLPGGQPVSKEDDEVEICNNVVEVTEPAPDGGLIAWSQVLVSHLLVVNGFGYISSFGLFESYWVTELDRSASAVSWVGSMQMFLLFFIGTLSGRAMDAGYFRSLIYAGCALQLLGTFTTSACKQYWQLFLSQGIVQGLGNGFLFTPAVALVSTYFARKRAFALGFAACGAPVGGMIFPVIARQLTPTVGFAWATRVMGFVMLFNTAIIIALARPRPASRIRGPIVEWSAFRELPYTLFAIGIFLALWGIYFAYYYVTTFGKDVIHVSSSTSLTLLMILNGVGIPGRLVPAYLADKYFGPFNTLIPFVSCAGILLLCWIGISSFGGFVAFVIVYGICSNAVQTLFPSTLSSLTTDLTKMGTRVGMVFTIVSVACLTGPPIAGALIDLKSGDFLYAQIFGGVTVLLGALTLLAARVVQLPPWSRPGGSRTTEAKWLTNSCHGFWYGGLNNLTVDSLGDVWFKDSDYSYGLSFFDHSNQNQLATYRLRLSTGELVIVDPNGITFSRAGKTLYITGSGLETVGPDASRGKNDTYAYPIRISTNKRNIYAFDVNRPSSAGTNPYLSNKRNLVGGSPDGIKITANDT